MKILKYLILFIMVIVGLIIAYMLGPQGQFGAIVLIDDLYFSILKKQYLFNGLLSSLLVCITAYTFKVNFKPIIFSLCLGGLLFVTSTQLSDLGNFKYVSSNILEFMLPFLGVSSVVVALLYGINRKWPRIT